MSKSKPAPAPMPAAPQPVNSRIYQDGFLTGETKNKGQDVYSYSTPFQQQQRQFAESNLPTVQNRILNPSGRMGSEIADANYAEHSKRFQESFGREQDNLIQNMSRRGLMNTSQAPYLTNELAKTAADRLNSIENQYIADQMNARSQEYNYNANIANMLQGGYGDQLQIQQQNLATPMNQAGAMNSFNLGNHQNQMDNWALQQALNPQKDVGWLPASKMFGMSDAQTIQMAASMASMASDKRLKENIEKITEVNGINIYKFNYKPEFIEKYNLPKGTQLGVIAQEVEHIPDVVSENEDGYKLVDYSKLPL